MFANRFVASVALLAALSGSAVAQEETEPTVLKAEQAGAGALSFSPDGKRLLAGGSYKDKTYIWDVKAGKPAATLNDCGDVMKTAAFSRNGALAVTVGMDTDSSRWRVVLWNGRNGKRIGELPPNSGWSAAVAPNGRVLAVAALGPQVDFYQLPGGQPLEDQKLALPAAAERIAYSPDGRSLVAVVDRSVLVFDTGSGEQKGALEPAAPVKSLAFAPDSRFLVAGLENGNVTCWNLATGAAAWNKEWHEKEVRGVAVSPDNKVAASAGQDGTVRFHVLRTGREFRVIKGKVGGFESAAYSPDGKTFAAGFGSGVALWPSSPPDDEKPAAGSSEPESTDRPKPADRPKGKRPKGARSKASPKP